jgi:hypothetical protein
MTADEFYYLYFHSKLGEGEAYVQGTKKVWFLER